MPNYNIIIPNKLTMESIDRLSNDIVSNQILDDYINIHNYEDMKRFDIEYHAINRHDRRAIKSKYRKLNKRKK